MTKNENELCLELDHDFSTVLAFSECNTQNHSFFKISSWCFVSSEIDAAVENVLNSTLTSLPFSLFDNDSFYEKKLQKTRNIL